MKRTITRLTVIVDDDGDEQLLALCDDGTVWQYDTGVEGVKWLPLLPIPQGEPKHE